MSDQVRIVAIFNAKPDRCDDLVQMLAALAPPSRAEPGCIEYGFHRDADDPNRVLAIETWRDEAAIAAHFETPHFQHLAANVEPLLTEPIKLHKCRPLI